MVSALLSCCFVAFAVSLQLFVFCVLLFCVWSSRATAETPGLARARAVLTSVAPIIDVYFIETGALKLLLRTALVHSKAPISHVIKNDLIGALFKNGNSVSDGSDNGDNWDNSGDNYGDDWPNEYGLESVPPINIDVSCHGGTLKQSEEDISPGHFATGHKPVATKQDTFRVK